MPSETPSSFSNVFDHCVFSAPNVQSKDGVTVVSFWVDFGDAGTGIGLATVSDELKGVNGSHGVTLTPDQARTLAGYLLEAANEIERQESP